MLISKGMRFLSQFSQNCKVFVQNYITIDFSLMSMDILFCQMTELWDNFIKFAPYSNNIVYESIRSLH